MNRCFAAIGIAAVLVLTSCSPSPVVTDTSAVVQALKDNEIQWNKDFEAKDLDKLLAHYGDDAVLISPTKPLASGRDAIRTAIKDMLADPGLSLKFQTTRVDVSKSGDLAYTQGSYNMAMTDPNTKKPITDKGSYVTVYKKQVDGWKAVTDIASSEVPPPAVAVAPKKAGRHPPAAHGRKGRKRG